MIASYLFLLQPFVKNFNKRIIKRPKLYYFDSGLVCYLLGITTEIQLASHPLRGAIFESYIISDIYKTIVHKRLTPDIYFWRDSSGKEIDLIVDLGGILYAIEISSGQTFLKKFSDHFLYWQYLEPDATCAIAYGSNHHLTYKGIKVHPWPSTANLLTRKESPESTANPLTRKDGDNTF